ncbi:hypothetical protein [Methylovirgula sp. 4M-Z18]|uniref:hypothetical protein n=1 Tax=Methylovirgula sp. 4M-Z18 TaxID=2293567 RepID=UPI000E2F7E54|nr:hypothetical protein [Methylovirgula sp. 4M-Z18]RFB77941.1 hypothetical protein DYH55_18135 [Methylovirgula sp. 4M-Z18]
MASYRFTLSSILAGIAAAALAAPALAASFPRVEVPISQTQLPDGNIRYSVPVSFGGDTAVMAMVDTGSIGLRVLTKAFSASAPQAEDTGVVRSYPFGSGVVLRGSLVRTVVAVGDAATAQPIVVQNVQEVTCGPERPNCPASKMDADSYGIGGDGIPNQGFQAILGVSIHKPRIPLAAGNPLSDLGDSWIVELPLPGDSSPGRLIINPTAAERKGYKMSSVPKPQVDPATGGISPDTVNKFSVCPKRSHCETVKLDTGAPDSLQVFYTYSVLYDQAHNAIGVKSR